MKPEGFCSKLCVFAALVCLLLLFPLGIHSPVLARQSFHQMNTAKQAQPAIFITDLARYSDDAVALLMLLRSRAFDIKGIITNAGNVCAGDAAQLTRALLQSVGASPLAVIEGPPLSSYEERRRFYLEQERPSWTRKDAYVGALSSTNLCMSEDTNSAGAASQTAAADFLIATAKENAGHLVIIHASPATVMAQALKKEPALASMLSHVYVMGGSLNVPGNVSPGAEFNVWFDPEAMAELFRSGAHITLVPLDATNPVTYDPASMGNLHAGGPGTLYLARYLEFRHADTRKVPMWDEVTTAIAIDPSVVSHAEERYLTVSTNRDTHYGEVSVLSAAHHPSTRPIRIVRRVDASMVREMLSRLVIDKK
jgi:inosine-uridine nucleoside N-ribohydrolase